MKRTEWDERMAEAMRKELTAVPTEAHRAIEDLLARLPERGRTTRRSRRSWTLAASALIVLIGASTVFAGNSSFAETVKQKFQSIFSEIGGPALQSEGRQEMGVLAERTDHSYTLKVHETIYDGQRLSISYSVSKPEGIAESLWVQPKFELGASMKAETPGVIGTDSGALRGQEKIGIVNYYFTDKAPDAFMLDVEVPAIAVFEDPSDQRLLPGDWSFRIPVEKQGEPVAEIEALPKATAQDVRFEARQVRLASRSTLWKLVWEYPSELRPNALIDSAPRYGMRYVIQAGDKEMTIAMSSQSSGYLTKGKRGKDSIRYSTTTLVTEQLPQGTTEATITPVLIAWNQDGDSGYTETALESYVLKVRLQPPVSLDLDPIK
ncbi:DUF4179 domain-containing protein [Paenibacillaceae bacterium WGS1546]|uniref:DUF4179 domain-containing protein n=1 Tax=Cohnella sp. WGS1546 TaxID=3366810 RepID=UPI00372D46EC